MKAKKTDLADLANHMPDTAEYEWQIVADCVMYSSNIPILQNQLNNQLFAVDDAKKAIEALCNLYSENQEYTLVDCKVALTTEQYSSAIGYIDRVEQGKSFEGHLSALSTQSYRRSMVLMGYKMIQAAKDNSRHLDELMELPGQLIDTLGKQLPGTDKGQTTEQVLQDYYKQLEDEQNGNRRSITTGFAKLDEITDGGFKAGQLIVISARPGAGKSVTMLQAAKAAAKAGFNAVIFSLEMMGTELAKRLLLSQGVRVSQLQNYEWETIDKAAANLEGLPIIFYDKAKRIEQIETYIHYRHSKKQADIVFIDYLGLIDRPGNRTTAEEIGKITSSLKSLAQQLEIPIVLLCQLNRASENEQRSPRLSDLRDSGAIEQDSDVVIMLEKVEPKSSEPNSSEYRTEDITIKQLVRKQRAGRAGLCNWLHPNSTYSQFVETGEITAIID